MSGSPKTSDAELWSIDTAILTKEGERTIFFDHMSKKIFDKGTCLVTVSVYSVPGQKSYRFMRERVMEDIDSIIFVYDLDPQRKQENIDAYNDVKDIMQTRYKKSIYDFPFLIQYNKCDLINTTNGASGNGFNGYFPSIKASAYQGIGVVESFVISVNQIAKFYDLPFTITGLDLGTN